MKCISVALERDLYEALDNFCRERGYTKRGLVVCLLREHLKNNNYLGEPKALKVSPRAEK
jgi:metal-responsive CopG/Arc/MetJ family transcriptional regulator